MDNYFSNVPFFKALLNQGIGAIGTARATANGFPTSLNIDKDDARRKLDWDHLCGEVVDQDVLALLWQDNNSVFLLSTIHECDSFTLSRRKNQRLLVPMLPKLAFHLPLMSIPNCSQFRKLLMIIINIWEVLILQINFEVIILLSKNPNLHSGFLDRGSISIRSPSPECLSQKEIYHDLKFRINQGGAISFNVFQTKHKHIRT